MNNFQLLQMMYAQRAAHFYMRISKALLRLELPIELTSHMSTGDEVVASMEHAMNLISDIPMPRILRAALHTAMVEWLSGMYLASGADEDMSWPLDAAMLTTVRLDPNMDLIDSILDGEVEIDEEDED